RIINARLPDEINNSDWSYGPEKSFIEDMLKYWATEYNWRRVENELNKFNHFKQKINGIDLHFIHHPSPHPDAIPLLLLHGWPSSFYEFTKVIDSLASPEKHNLSTYPAFHVVVPSLPGFGFSTASQQSGFGVKKISSTLHELMKSLKYNKFLVQGGDWGAAITRNMALTFPKSVLGIHLNMAIALPPTTPFHIHKLLLLMVFPRMVLTEKEIDNLRSFQRFTKEDSGYYSLQSTKPQLPAFALNDSPVGLLAWNSGLIHGVGSLPREDLITNVMIYWISQSIGSSMRLYKEENFAGRNGGFLSYWKPYCSVPTGVSVFPKEFSRPPRAWVAHSHNLVYWNEAPKGGHFPALQVPKLYIAHIRECFSTGVFKKLMKARRIRTLDSTVSGKDNEVVGNLWDEGFRGDGKPDEEVQMFDLMDGNLSRLVVV
ncbi:hypothetical protein HK098_006993, partial [Nowakowskiella sp. JEL0407]